MQNSEGVVGVLGGLGPDTTSEFNLSVTYKYLAINPARRPTILSLYIGLDLALEKEFVEHANGGEKYLPYLIDGIKRLEKGGASFIVIPCNSVHVYIGQMRETAKVPILSIIEETANFLKSANVHRLGILATPITLSSKMFHNLLGEEGIEIIEPIDQDQALLSILISRIVRQQHTFQDRQSIVRIMENLKRRGAEEILLACTDLQSIIQKEQAVYDTMDILADATVRRLVTE